MYQRFTDRARKVVQLANQEAQRYNHDYIGTEHLLLGLIKEGGGVASQVLQAMNIDLRMVRAEVEQIIQPGPDVMIGRSAKKLPQTPRMKRVLELAIEEARGLHHNYVGTEHLLLGLLREGDNVAATVLVNLGVQLTDLRVNVLKLISPDALTAPASFKEPLALPTTAERAFDVMNRLLDLFQAMKMESVAAGTVEHAAEVNEQMTHLLAIKAWLQRQLHRQPPDEHEHGIQEL